MYLLGPKLVCIFLLLSQQFLEMCNQQLLKQSITDFAVTTDVGYREWLSMWGVEFERYFVNESLYITVFLHCKRIEVMIPDSRLLLLLLFFSLDNCPILGLAIARQFRVQKSDRRCHYDTPPRVSTSKQMSHTLTGLFKSNLIIGISFIEHLWHKRRPQ